MAVNETIVTGRKFRKLIDEATKLWQRISFWTKASDVEFDDGKTAEIKAGAIDGITDSLASTSSRIAASAKADNTLNENLQGFTPIVDETGKITGYKTSVGGADTVFPFGVLNNFEILKVNSNQAAAGNVSSSITVPDNVEECICLMYVYCAYKRITISGNTDNIIQEYINTEDTKCVAYKVESGDTISCTCNGYSSGSPSRIFFAVIQV